MYYCKRLCKVCRLCKICKDSQTLVFSAFRFPHGDKSLYKFFSFACWSFEAFKAHLQRFRACYSSQKRIFHFSDLIFFQIFLVNWYFSFWSAGLFSFRQFSSILCQLDWLDGVAEVRVVKMGISGVRQHISGRGTNALLRGTKLVLAPAPELKYHSRNRLHRSIVHHRNYLIIS